MKGHLFKVVATAMLWMLCHVAHAGTVTYVYTDPQGTPLAEADASGNITARFDYAPYGTAVASMSPAPNGPGYTGHVNDPDTGLVYMQARYYDPAVGRFLSVDPVGPAVGNGFNFGRYDYANNNPIINIDPDGRTSWDDVKAFILPTTMQLASRGAPGNAGNNGMGALKQFGNQVLGGMALTSGNPILMANIPQIPIANNELAGAATVEVGTAVVGAVAGLAGRAGSGTTTLFRAVNNSEFAQIAATGTFESGAGSLEGKWFAESAEHASTWGNLLNGEGNFILVKANMPASQANQLFRLPKLDNIGPARFGTVDQLRGAKISW